MLDFCTLYYITVFVHLPSVVGQYAAAYLFILGCQRFVSNLPS